METERPLIRACGLKKSFDTKNKSLLGFLSKGGGKVYAVDDITFELGHSEILGLIGESGCGKSMTAKLLLKLLQPDEGGLWFEGKDITHLAGAGLAEYRRRAQIIFQDPYEYLNPRLNVLDCVGEPLTINKLVSSRAQKVERASKYLELVGVSPAGEYLYRYPHELSGGQRQRVAIARALVMEPKFIVADEPTSMLDVSVRAGILNLLRNLKSELGVSMVFITHDIATAGYVCDRIAVMYKGRIVEIGNREDIIFDARHPYTKALVRVAVNLREFLEGSGANLKGGEVNSFEKTERCPFEHRCLQYDDLCRDADELTMRQVSPGHYVLCCKCG